MYTSKLKIKTSSVNVCRSLCWWPGLSACLVTSSILKRAGHRKSPTTVTAETMARHDEKIFVGRAKVLSGGDTGYRLAEVDEVLGCLVVQTVHHMRPSLNATRFGTLSQCSLVCKIRDKPQSNLCVPQTTRAAAFSKHFCSLPVVTLGALVNTALQWSTRDDTNAWTSVVAESVSSYRRERRSCRNQ